MRLCIALITLLAGLALAGPAAAAPSDQRFVLNETPIVLASGQGGVGNPYPSTVDVSGLSGRITNVSVSLRGVTHERPANLDILLVAPDGRRSIVMSDACGSTASNRAFWFVEETAASAMPKSESCSGFFYRPTNHADGFADVFPAPAPPGPWPTGFGTFTGGDPNGTWTLYVANRFSYFGKIEHGWALTVTAVAAEARLPESNSAYTLSDPYPLKRTVSGMSGIVTDVNVSLKGLHHENPDDLDFALVGPNEKAVKLMSDACGTDDMLGRTLTFDDEAAGYLSDDALSGCADGTYRPSDFAPAAFDYFPSGPVIDVGKQTALSDFDLSDPNGRWALYVSDDTGSDASRGLIEDGYTLDIKTRPRAKVAFAAPSVSVAEGEVREVVVKRDKPPTPLGPGSVTVTSTPGTATSATDFRPLSTKVDFAAGETEKTILVAAQPDAEAEGPETFTLSLGEATGDAAAGTPVTVTVEDKTVPPEPGGGSDGGGGAGGGEPGAGGGGTVGGGGLGVGPVADRTAPVIRSLALSRARVTRRRGTQVRYTLSEPATVSVRLERASGKRFVRAAKLRGGGRTGANKVPVRKLLRPGAYRVIVTAVDRAGNRSVARQKRFRVTN